MEYRALLIRRTGVRATQASPLDGTLQTLGTLGTTGMHGHDVHDGRSGDAGVAPTGYVIATDRYFKRDDVGIVYQMNVVPGRQRGLVGATLLKAVFDRAAYGCRLFCCWCAQDIAANRFWEAMGFVPLAYRAGSGEGTGPHLLAAADWRGT